MWMGGQAGGKGGSPDRAPRIVLSGMRPARPGGIAVGLMSKEGIALGAHQEHIPPPAPFPTYARYGRASLCP